MRRHRFGRLAASAAVLYLAALAVVAVVDRELLWQIVTRGDALGGAPMVWWSTLVVAPVAAVQAWAYWQVLRGPERDAGPVGDRRIRLLRTLLYVSAATSMIPLTFIFMRAGSGVWWLTLPGAVMQPVIIWLFFRVLEGVVPTWWRLLVLVPGLAASLPGLALTPTYALDLVLPAWAYTIMSWGSVAWMAWMAPLLAAQARDPRWSRATVRIGVLALLVSLIQPTSVIDIYSGVSYKLMVFSLLSAVSVFGMVWEARTAHELAGTRAAPAARRPVRMPARAWPLPALAIALPLVPAAVNLAGGMPFWIGPRGEVQRVVIDMASYEAALAWVALDVLVGVGAPALLVLAAVLRRTLRLVRATILTLVLLAAAGVISAFTVTTWEGFPDDLPLYPDGLFVTGPQGELSFGISPLWYSAALLASAFLLLSLYGAAPALRMRRHVLVAGIAVTVVLGFLPSADQARGPVTTAADCAPPELWTEEEPRVLTPEEAYVCRIREGSTPLKFSDTTPDQVILAQGRRLCGVYTRNDPRELAGQRLDRGALAWVLGDICPSAAATLKTAQDAQDREYAAWKADAQRMCDSTPRHRPLIKPAERTVIRKPQWTDHGVLEAIEHLEDYDPSSLELLDRAQDNGLTAARPGHLIVLVHSDLDLCVTIETYTRRPPVETKGWDHVVEVGYASPTGTIELRDNLGEAVLPDLALKGRKGHYRIRVHYDQFPWK
ncbi:hypothetical protein OUY22_18785 [Nonomuraea sp. MCN248]|uniref:MFS transporter n=1 Tax=Nonomuraea corallina TaxID=2989783 RepID=A0ABT4SE89_9ACTN|nr:hypothetical protein [Nonomuraea corallina]MDA0635470.1 hypothetical protein [Nonomuraea corallina]